jgi:hypothetical protein
MWAFFGFVRHGSAGAKQFLGARNSGPRILIVEEQGLHTAAPEDGVSSLSGCRRPCLHCFQGICLLTA